MSIDGDILTIKVDLTQPGSLSTTGKTMLVASTRGIVPIITYPKREGIKVVFNVLAPVTNRSEVLPLTTVVAAKYARRK